MFRHLALAAEKPGWVSVGDPARLMPDPDHSVHDSRFLALSISHLHRLLVVCHRDRKRGSVIRIISARKATRREARHYLG